MWRQRPLPPTKARMALQAQRNRCGLLRRPRHGRAAPLRARGAARATSGIPSKQPTRGTAASTAGRQAQCAPRMPWRCPGPHPSPRPVPCASPSGFNYPPAAPRRRAHGGTRHRKRSCARAGAGGGRRRGVGLRVAPPDGGGCAGAPGWARAELSRRPRIRARARTTKQSHQSRAAWRRGASLRGRLARMRAARALWAGVKGASGRAREGGRRVASEHEAPAARPEAPPTPAAARVKRRSSGRRSSRAACRSRHRCTCPPPAPGGRRPGQRTWSRTR